MTRTFSELSKLKTFEERYEYLRLKGYVGQSTFGQDRYLNQWFYKTEEWQSVRREVIIRDEGCEMGLDGYSIGGHIYVHHMNPITVEDVINRNPDILNPEFLICVSKRTHDAIHYNRDVFMEQKVTVRTPHDTSPWRRREE